MKKLTHVLTSLVIVAALTSCGKGAPRAAQPAGDTGTAKTNGNNPPPTPSPSASAAAPVTKPTLTPIPAASPAPAASPSAIPSPVVSTAPAPKPSEMPAPVASTVPASEKPQQSEAQEIEEPRSLDKLAYLHLTHAEHNSAKRSSDASNASNASEAPSLTQADLRLLEQTRADSVCKAQGFGYAEENGWEVEELLAEVPSTVTLAIVNDEGKEVAQEINALKGDITSYFSSVKCLK